MVEVQNPPDGSSRWLAIFIALFIGFVYLFGFTMLLGTKQRIEVSALQGFPLLQFLYIGPLAYFARGSGRNKAMQGWLIGAAVAAVLYSPCWGLMWLTQR